MKKNICLLLIFLCSFLIMKSYGQSADENLVKLADEMYGFGDKKDALAVYLQAIEANPNSVSANYMAGKCYLETVGKELSVNYLIKAYELKPDVSADVLFKIGNGFQFGGKFADALKYYTLYKQNITEIKAKTIGSTIKDEIIKTERKIFECKNGANYYKNINHFRIENLKDVVNSEYPDYAPSVTADQSTMIFTSRRAGGVGKNKDVDNEYFEDIWISKKNPAGEWGEPQNLGPPINGESHDGSIGLSPDGKKIFIYKPDNGGDIFVTEIMSDGKWAIPINISANINTKYNEPSVSITKDGKALYFSSNKPGGFGGFDIYKSELDKVGKWGKAINMGSVFNTEFDEDAPFIDFDGKTLYFSSRGLNGMGGYDLYKSIFDTINKNWTQPINMGYPLNSPDDDIYFVIAGDGKTGYYSSAKGDGYGDKDIYKIYFEEPKVDSVNQSENKIENISVKKDSVIAPQIAKVQTPITVDTSKKVKNNVVDTPKAIVVEGNEIAEAPKSNIETNYNVVKEPKVKTTTVSVPKPQVQKPKIVKELPVVEEKQTFTPIPAILRINIYDKQTNMPLPATVLITDLKGKLVKEITVTEVGALDIELPSKYNTKYIITANSNGFIYTNVNVTVPADAKLPKNITRDIAMKKIYVGQGFVLRNIYYDFDKANIKKESFPYLDNLYKWLKSKPNIHIVIEGHTDNLGLNSYNKILSQHRVDAVMRYLTAKGIAGERLEAMGYGEEKPLASNDDEQEGREINRRTVFKISKE